MERPSITQQEERHAALAARLRELGPFERAEFDRLDAARDLRRRRLDQQLATARVHLARLEARRVMYEGRELIDG